MSSRHGLQSVALGGLIACIGLSAYGQDAAKPASQKPTQAAATPAKPAAPPTPPKYSAPYKPRCEAPRDYNEASLCEERKATEIALEANEVSRRNFWLSLAGLGALIVTIYYTARAALAADEAAKAAEKSVANAEADAAEQAERFKQQLKIAKDSVDAARASVIATDRAWLELKVKVSGPLVFEGDDVSITVTCVCKNIGRAPASGIVWATDIFASAGDAFAYAMDRTRYNFIGATSSMGDVMFPAAKTNHTITLTMSRAKFIEDCEALANNPELEWGAARSWPHIVVGVHYALPGDNRRRFTHQAYYLARRHDGDGDFDGSEGRLEKGEIELVPSNMSLPIT